MKRKQSLAEQFTALQAEKRRIDAEYLKLKSAYFADRRIRAKRGRRSSSSI